jgi:hypothetical protein
VSVTITSGNNTIILDKTGTDTATLTVGSSTYNLTNIRVSGNTLTCQTQELWIEPIITVTWTSSEVQVTVSNSDFDDGISKYPISEEDYSSLLGFLNSSNFPKGP